MLITPPPPQRKRRARVIPRYGTTTFASPLTGDPNGPASSAAAQVYVPFATPTEQQAPPPQLNPKSVNGPFLEATSLPAASVKLTCTDTGFPSLRTPLKGLLPDMSGTPMPTFP